MRRFCSVLAIMLLFSATVFAGDGILEKLRAIPHISDIKTLEVANFKEYYQFYFEQPIDHADPSKGTFRQRVLLGHNDVCAPVIAELEGYGIHTAEAGELAMLFNGNQLTIEHRFFDSSVPEGDIPWDCLTIKQAADDQHEIIQAVKKEIYPDSKWVTTGISKGGQTTIFHRYFYPEDADVSVPYVAPLNLEYIDPRLEKFLDRLGNGKGGFNSMFAGEDVNAVRWTVRDFQLLCFRNQERLAVMLDSLAQAKGYTYQTVGGVKRALQLLILEFPFSFWQWGYNPADIPEEESAEWNEIFGYLVRVSSPDFFEDKYIERMRPFFYAALTETGMYAYNVKPFKKYMPDEDNSIDFSFAMPAGVGRKSFNEGQMKAIEKWLQTKAEKILFVYGGRDPWYATGVNLKDNWKCRKYVRGDMSHLCRIKDFDPVSKEDLMDTLKEWLED